MGAPTIVSHWFSFARSPPGGLARSGFWLGRLIRNGGVSPEGAYAPRTPGATNGLGANATERIVLSKIVLSCPRLHDAPVNAGQVLVALFCTDPTTGTLPAYPSAPEHGGFGGGCA